VLFSGVQIFRILQVRQGAVGKKIPLDVVESMVGIGVGVGVRLGAVKSTPRLGLGTGLMTSQTPAQALQSGLLTVENIWKELLTKTKGVRIEQRMP